MVHLNTYCLQFAGVESNGYFYGPHSMGSDEVAHVSFFI